mgnify:CR=1 FL=1
MSIFINLSELPLGNAVEAGPVGVVGRRLAVDLHRAVKAILVPVEPEIPVMLGGEEVQLLRLRHVDVGVKAEVMVDRGGAALEAADDDHVRQGGRLAAATRQATVSVRGEALAGARAHGIISRVVGGLGGGHVCIGGFRHGRVV